MVEEASAVVDRPARSLPRLVRVRRRGPVLRPSRVDAGASGLYGLDLTAGCAFDCSFCYVRGTIRHPGPDRLLFDPAVVDLVGPALDALERPARCVVLSPSSDPLPPSREVRAATLRVLDVLLARGLEVVLLTRGRITRDVVSLFASAPDRVRVGLGIATLSRSIGRTLEPLAPPGRLRLKGLERLVEAGVPVEARLEPLVLGLTDTRENLRPLLAELARVGIREATAHHLFLQPAILPPLRDALATLGLAERLADDYEGGPVFSIGEAGATKHLPLDDRRESLARVVAWGAEAGLVVRTGATQNPDLPRIGGPAIASPSRPGSRRRRPKASSSKAG